MALAGHIKSRRRQAPILQKTLTNLSFLHQTPSPKWSNASAPAPASFRNRQPLPEMVHHGLPEHTSGHKGEIIRLNVGGKRFEIDSEKLARFPETRLGKIAAIPKNELSKFGGYYYDKYLPEANEYFIDRSGEMVDQILDLYRHGKIHLDWHSICQKKLSEELNYWGIGLSHIPSCCRYNNQCNSKGCSGQKQLQIDQNKSDSGLDSAPQTPPAGLTNSAALRSGVQKASEIPSNEPEGLSIDIPDFEEEKVPLHAKYRSLCWDLLDDPGSSIPAIIYMVISVIFIILTIAVLMLGSMQGFQIRDNVTNTTEPIPELETVDFACVVFFSVDYLLRVAVAPDRLQYIRQPMSIIDVLAISPFYFELLFNAIGVGDSSIGGLKQSLILMRILRVLRVMRVLRILKVARYSKGFQSMGSTISRSWRELFLMIMFMITTNLMFSTAVYFVEGEEYGSKFTSIPASMWWCIITMTTVGYGDVTPVTPAGKIIASVASITGILLLAFPISIVVQNFDEEYSKEVSSSRMSLVSRRASQQSRSRAHSLATSEQMPFTISGKDRVAVEYV